MGKLTVVAYNTRRIIKYGSIGIVTLLVFLRLFSAFRAYWKKKHPPPPPPPTVQFGKLPKLKFKETSNLPTLTYKLGNVTGTLPKLDTVGKVFVMPKSYPNLLAWDRTKTWARGLGFLKEPEKISDFELKFETGTFPNTTLTANVLTRNFKLSYDWQNDLSILSIGNPPEENLAISMAKNYLQTINMLNDDLMSGKGKVTYFKYKDGVMVKTPFVSEANFAQVNLFRQDIDNLPLLPPNPLKANVNLTLSGGEEEKRKIIEVEFTYFPVYKENFATYPLLPINKAWEKLNEGKGFVANLGNNSGAVNIRNIYLAYFEDSEQQDFLQPIYVFEGDNEFFAYVQAVAEEWLQ